MNVADAAYAVVHDYEGGSESLAPRLGMSAAVLRAKVNRNTDRNILSLREAVDITVLSGDLRILEAFAAELECTVMPIESAMGQGATVLSTLMQRSVAEGELMRTVHDALQDGVISSNEWDAIAGASGNVQGVTLSLLRQLMALRPRGAVASA